MRLAFALSLLSCCALAHADTIQQTTLSGPFTTNGYYQGNPLLLQGFNPQLGTLTSVAFQVSGQIEAVGGPASAQGYTSVLGFYIGPNLGHSPFFGGIQDLSFSATGAYTIFVPFSDSNSADLAYFTTAGGIAPLFQYTQGLAGSDSSTGLTIGVTYTYTAAPPPPPPSAITPEPSTLALLGTGLVGVAGAFRKRFL